MDEVKREIETLSRQLTALSGRIQADGTFEGEQTVLALAGSLGDAADRVTDAVLSVCGLSLEDELDEPDPE